MCSMTQYLNTVHPFNLGKLKYIPVNVCKICNAGNLPSTHNADAFKRMPVSFYVKYWKVWKQ